MTRNHRFHTSKKPHIGVAGYQVGQAATGGIDGRYAVGILEAAFE